MQFDEMGNINGKTLLLPGILEGRKDDPRFYPVVFGLPDDADWTDEKNWYKANPSLGQTITIDEVLEYAYEKGVLPILSWLLSLVYWKDGSEQYVFIVNKETGDCFEPNYAMESFILYMLTSLGHESCVCKKIHMVIDEAEAAVVREIYHLLTEEGYGTNRVAQYLNDQGIKTKKGKPNWRGTTIRSMVENPIYTGVLTFGDERSEPFENLRIIDDAQFERCNEIVKGRSPKYYQQETIVPIRTDSRSLLTGILFCADCGSRMCYSHNVVRRKLADGTPRIYERNLYRCYKKVSSKKACSGQSAYDMEPINAAVEKEVKKFLKRLASKPRDALLEVASARNEKSYQAALEQAEKDYANAQKQVNALVEEAIKALTGESQLDLSVVNTMIIKHRARRDAAEQAIEEARERLEQEQITNKETQAQINEMLSWVDCYAKANVETKHMIISRIIERVEIKARNKIHIKFKISLDQFMEKEA